LNTKYSAETQLPFFLLIDGNDFEECIWQDKRIPFQTFVRGDDSFASIAAASILAKYARDQYIRDLCIQYPLLSTNYGMDKHMGYGTKQHLEAIKTYGATQYHRRSFGCCKVAKPFIV